MRERATVVKAAGKIATVRIVKNPQCESCRACAFKNGKSTVNVKAKNEIGATVGDSVTIACEKDNRTLASFLVYIVPVLFAGLGVADTLLGIAVSVLKYLLVLSVLFSAFDALNEDYCLVGPRTIERSKSYKPVRWLSESIFPFLEWVGERVPRQEEKTETDG